MKKSIVFAVSMVVMSFCMPVVATNLVVNGNFEQGNTGFSTGYTYSPGNLWNGPSYTVDYNPSDNHPLAPSYGDHTTGIGKMMIFNGYLVTAWQQTISVQPNTWYQVSFWGSNWVSSPTTHVPSTVAYSVNGTNLGSLTVSTYSGLWTQASSTYYSGQSNIATLRLVETTVTNASFALDDISLSPIPEPTTIALFGLGGLFLRRKKK
jgi:hypothetical protein